MTLIRSSIAWHVYSLTHSAFHLGMIGLVQFVPALLLTLVGGVVADTYDRKRVINLAQLVTLSAGALLWVATGRGDVSVQTLYVTVFCISCALAFETPARMALLPSLIPREIFPRAVTLSSTNQALAFATGPALGGLVIAAAGVRAAYAAYVVLLALAFISMFMLRAGERGSGPRRGISLSAIAEGLAFVWSKPVVLGCMTLDMFAVIFGGASALLPIFANDILGVGARGYGLLTSSLEIGALAMSLMLILRKPVRRAGRVLLLTVAVFGLTTVVFGLSRSFPLSVAAYMLAGMADQVSVVMRSTAIQLSTPDELRGRVSAVSMVFIGASNQLGAVESGLVASFTSATFAVVSGGLGCLLVVAWVAWRLPALRRYEVEPALA